MREITAAIRKFARVNRTSEIDIVVIDHFARRHRLATQHAKERVHKAVLIVFAQRQTKEQLVILDNKPLRTAKDNITRVITEHEIGCHPCHFDQGRRRQRPAANVDVFQPRGSLELRSHPFDIQPLAFQRPRQGERGLRKHSVIENKNLCTAGRKHSRGRPQNAVRFQLTESQHAITLERSGIQGFLAYFLDEAARDRDIFRGRSGHRGRSRRRVKKGGKEYARAGEDKHD
jgi:hypothetical protein